MDSKSTNYVRDVQRIQITQAFQNSIRSCIEKLGRRTAEGSTSPKYVRDALDVHFWATAHMLNRTAMPNSRCSPQAFSQENLRISTHGHAMAAPPLCSYDLAGGSLPGRVTLVPHNVMGERALRRRLHDTMVPHNVLGCLNSWCSLVSADGRFFCGTAVLLSLDWELCPGCAPPGCTAVVLSFVLLH